MGEQEQLNLYQKLAKIRKLVEVLQKNAKGFNYKYVSEDVILAKVTAGMEKYHVSLIPSIVSCSSKVTPLHFVKTKSTKEGKIYEEHVNDILVEGELNYTWVDDNNPDDEILVPWFFVGQQGDASQAFGSGLTYASRYFLLKYFSISTSSDDPDKWRSEQAAASKEEEIATAKAIAGEVDKLAKAYLKDDQKEAFATLVKGIVKDKNKKPTANYFELESPELASKLLDEVKKFFKITEEKADK